MRRLLIACLISGSTLYAASPTEKAVINHFHHAAWTSEDGLGAVMDIAQASDGFLWLTTSRGVLRFDGVRFSSLDEVTNGMIHGSDFNSVFVAKDGILWFTTRTGGLLRWNGGKLASYPDRHCTAAAQFGGIAEDQEGALWFQSSSGLFRLRNSVCERIGEEHGVPSGLPAALLVDRRGAVWVKSRSGSLYVLQPGKTKFQFSEVVSAESPHQGILHEAPDGSLWLSDTEGLRQVISPAGTPVPGAYPHRAKVESENVLDFTFDTDGSLWHATSNGVEMLEADRDAKQLSDFHAGNRQGYTPEQGLTSNAVRKLFVGREGNVWIATNSGLDKFRKTPFVSVVLPHTYEHEFAVVPGEDGSAWIGNGSLPLTHVFPDGHTARIVETHQVVCLRRDSSGAIWAADAGGDVHLWKLDGKGLQSFHFPGDQSEGIAALEVDSNGDPWILTWSGLLFRRAGENWLNQNAALDRKPGVLGAMTTDEQGNLWIAFSNKLFKWDGKGFEKFSFADQTLNLSVSTMAARGEHVWLAGRGGVALFIHGQFHLTRWSDNSLPGRVSGIVETKTGELWINSFSGVTHASSAELARWISNPSSAIMAKSLGPLDGLPGFSGERLPEPSLVSSPEGNLWFATTKGVAWLDPQTFEKSRNVALPVAVVSSITADGRSYSVSKSLKLPKYTEHLQIDYTAPGLSIPSRVQFRYKLEGIDAEWQNAGTRRQAYYTSLPPGPYTFRVAACNDEGACSERGDTLRFDLIPAFRQTIWFKLLCFSFAMAILWLLSVLRLRLVTNELRARMTERIHERERIARELHDTLLQSFQGLIMYFQLAIDRIGRDDPSRLALEEALRHSDEVMIEGRNRVRNLRGGLVNPVGLAQALAAHSEEMRRVFPGEFELLVEGFPRTLQAIAQEELCQIGKEALTNAYRHSGASKIQVKLEFKKKNVALCVQDNGLGIPEDVLRAWGRDGHWGLTGMRERTKKIGAEFQVQSRREEGTTIKVKIAAALVYQKEGTLISSLKLLPIFTGKRSSRNLAAHLIDESREAQFREAIHRNDQRSS